MATWTGDNWLISLSEAKSTFFREEASITTKDTRIGQYIADASVHFETFTRRKFIPYTDTRVFCFESSDRVSLDADLLSISTITTNEGSTTLTSGQYVLLPQNRPPYDRVAIRSNSANHFTYSDDIFNATSITGSWGYSNRTLDITTLSANVSDTTGTTVSVTSASALSVGHHILINSEQMFIESISTNDLTVARGINGTTATTHTSADTVSIYRPPADVVQTVGLLAARLQKRAVGAGADVAGASDNRFRVGSSLPADAYNVMTRYRRVWI